MYFLYLYIKKYEIFDLNYMSIRKVDFYVIKKIVIILNTHMKVIANYNFNNNNSYNVV